MRRFAQLLGFAFAFVVIGYDGVPSATSQATKVIAVDPVPDEISRAPLLAEVEAQRKDGDSRALARALRLLGHFDFRQARIELARESHREALAVCDRIGDEIERAVVLVSFADIERFYGDRTEARRLVEESIRLAQKNGARIIEAYGIQRLGDLDSADQQWTEAAARYARALDIYQSQDNVQGEAASRIQLAKTLRQQKRFDEAHEHLRVARAMFRLLQNRHGEGNAEIELAVLAIHTNDPADARDGAERAVAIFRELGVPKNEAAALYWLGWAAWLQRDVVEARRAFTEAVAVCRRLDDQRGVQSAQAALDALNRGAVPAGSDGAPAR